MAIPELGMQVHGRRKFGRAPKRKLTVIENVASRAEQILKRVRSVSLACSKEEATDLAAW